MVLVIETRKDVPTPAPEPGHRSTEQALVHMHWHFQPADASALYRRRPLPLVSPPPARETP